MGKAFRRETLTVKELHTFTARFNILFGAGVPLGRALEGIGEGSSPLLSSVSEAVAVDVMSGHSFSGAMARQARSFPADYRGVVMAGERSGSLIPAMRGLEFNLERRLTFRRRLQSALAYPLVLLLSTLTMLTGLVYGLFPMILKTTEHVGVEPPALTRFVKSLLSTDALSYVFTLAVVLFLGAQIGLRHEFWGPRLRSAWELYTPFGRVKTTTVLIRTLRQLALLIESGVPILTALTYCEQVCGDSWLLTTALKRVGQDLRLGKPLPEAMACHRVFPPLLISLLTVSDEVGSLGVVLHRICNFMEEELQDRLLSFLNSLEPILLGVMGLVVGVVVLAAFLPIYQLVEV